MASMMAGTSLLFGGPTIAERKARLLADFSAQVARDPRLVLEAIYGKLAQNGDAAYQSEVLGLLESALAECAPSTSQQAPLFKLKLSHVCIASGCGLAHCDLCRENPSRACVQAISARNLVETELKAQCGARVDVHIEPADPSNTTAVPPPYRLQVCVIEKANCTDATWRELENYALLTYRKPNNNEVHRLLAVNLRSADAPMGHMAADNFVYFPSADVHTLGPCTSLTVVTLPDLVLKASGESVVKSKLPELALAIRAVDQNLQPLDDVIQPVYSNYFQVATKRTKGNMKVDIPFITTDVSKIEGIGTETKQKLFALDNHGYGYDKVENVGQLRSLIAKVSNDEAEKARLIKALKMNKESWECVVAHASRAVGIDNRMRVFLRVAKVQPRRDVGLVFACEKGEVKICMESIQGYVERQNAHEHLVHWDQVQLMYGLRDFCLATLLGEAQDAWGRSGHPGWDIYRPHNMEVRSREELPCTDGGSASYPISLTCRPALSQGIAIPPWNSPPPLIADDQLMQPPPPSPPLHFEAPAEASPRDPRLRTHDHGADPAAALDTRWNNSDIDRAIEQAGIPLDPLSMNIFMGTNTAEVLTDMLAFAGTGTASFLDQQGNSLLGERGTVRQNRSFELPNYSGSFAAPQRNRQRLGTLTSSGVNDTFEASHPADLLELTPPEAAHHPDGAPDCFRTAGDYDNENEMVRSYTEQEELQQASMSWRQGASENGLNPFFQIPSDTNPH